MGGEGDGDGEDRSAAVHAEESVSGGVDVWSDAVSSHDPDHLLVMVHGILGSTADWQYGANEFVKQLSDDVIVHSSWWRLYGTETPALQKMATRILSLCSSSSGCERNWSGFDGIHTKKRNRLTTARLEKLVYVQFNSRLLNRREKIKSKKNTEVLLSSDTSEVQGFLQEGGDECALVVFRDDEEDEGEMEGTGIPWSVLGEAVGAEEELQPRRSARVRELYEGEEFESEEEEFDEDEDYIDPY